MFFIYFLPSQLSLFDQGLYGSHNSLLLVLVCYYCYAMVVNAIIVMAPILLLLLFLARFVLASLMAPANPKP